MYCDDQGLASKNLWVLCPIHLSRQNDFCPRQNQNCLRQNIFCPEQKILYMDKKFIISDELYEKWLFSFGQNFLSWTKMIMSSAPSICPDKIFFVQDKIKIVPDKIIFCPGQKILSIAKKSLSILFKRKYDFSILEKKLVQDKNYFVMEKFDFVQKTHFDRSRRQGFVKMLQLKFHNHGYSRQPTCNKNDLLNYFDIYINFHWFLYHFWAICGYSWKPLTLGKMFLSNYH